MDIHGFLGADVKQPSGCLTFVRHRYRPRGEISGIVGLFYLCGNWKH